MKKPVSELTIEEAIAELKQISKNSNRRIATMQRKIKAEKLLNEKKVSN
jgi:hypothetical protein